MNTRQISLLAAFLAAHVDYVVVGGAAVNAHGYVRVTNDLDVFIRPTQEKCLSRVPWPAGRRKLKYSS